MKKPITLDDIYVKKVFNGKGLPQFHFLKDGKYYSRLEESKAVNLYNLGTGKKVRTLFDVKAMKKLGVEKIFSYSFSEDESKLLLAVNHEKIYRRTFRASYYVYDIASKKLQPVSARKGQMLAQLSPDCTKVSFVHENDLYIADLKTGRETRVTRDGAPTKIINGAPDWVYEEEWSLTYAHKWSPDSKSLAFLRFDESQVPEYVIPFYHGTSYPEPFRYKYPRAGEKNSVVTAHVFSLKDGKTRKIATEKGDIYLPRLQWNKADGHLYILQVNRLQNWFEWVRVAPGQTRVQSVYEETNERWCEIDTDLHFLSDGSGMVIRTSRSGRWHLILCKNDGTYLNHITDGEWDVSALKGIDCKRRLVYFESTKDSHLQRQLYRVSLDGTGMQRLTKGGGVHSCSMNGDCSLFIDNHSTLDAPSRYVLCACDGTEKKVLEDNSELKERLKKFNLGRKEMLSFKTKEGLELFGWIIKPKNFDPKKKYPLFMTFYNGPHSQAATESWTCGWERYLNDKGYITVCVDGRGTGWRGEDFLKCTYKQLGRYEVIDQIAAARYFGSLPYVDEKRIGVFGWSYGGFMASSLMLRGGDVFKAGVAVASVTSWKFYDTIYTERFMQTPQLNPKGYEDWSPMKFASGLTGKLLLVHGLADDNVHFQNSLALEEALIKAGKQFEMHYVLNKDHGISGPHTTPHLFTRILNFITENL